MKGLAGHTEKGLCQEKFTVKTGLDGNMWILPRQTGKQNKTKQNPCFKSVRNFVGGGSARGFPFFTSYFFLIKGKN